ncbi:MAG: flavodoxin family protein [Actinomycetota bacterium]
MMKVIGFNGSPRENGNTRIAINTVFRQLEKNNIETEIINMGEYNIKACTGCLKCIKMGTGYCALDDDKLNGWLNKIYSADGIIIGSPVYFASMTSQAKALVDRLGYCARVGGFLLKGKVCCSVAVVRRQGAVCVLNQINNMFLANQTVMPSSSSWNFAVGRHPGEVRKDEEGMETLKILGENMAWLLRKVAKNKDV